MDLSFSSLVSTSSSELLSRFLMALHCVQVAIINYSFFLGKFFNLTRTIGFLLQSVFLLTSCWFPRRSSFFSFSADQANEERRRTTEARKSWPSCPGLLGKSQTPPKVIMVPCDPKLRGMLLFVHLEYLLWGLERWVQIISCRAQFKVIVKTDNYQLNSMLNTITDFVVKAITFFWPYFLTCKIFWCSSKKLVRSLMIYKKPK
jgi:hypothetical protein